MRYRKWFLMLLISVWMMTALSACQFTQSVSRLVFPPTATSTATATAVPPTATITATVTATVTVTATATMTATAVPTATSTPRPLPTRTKAAAGSGSSAGSSDSSGCSGGNTAIESSLLALINRERQNQGLSLLSNSSALTTAAREHSRDMAENNYFSHTGSDGSSPFDRMQRAGYSFTAAAENIYAGNGSNNSAGSAFSAWMASDGHRENMLNSAYADAGVGYWCDSSSEYGGYFTLTLGHQ